MKYEGTLREWRHRLEHAAKDTLLISEIRNEIIAFRTTLRALGYDVRLGSYRITFEGFRHDDATAEGFRRAVLFITKNTVYYITGSDNHNELSGFLEARIARSRSGDILQKHYLWYLWRQQTLVFSGADTETKEAFDQLKESVGNNKAFFMKQLQKLR